MNTVELVCLQKAYGEFVAVNGLSLSIRPGEIYGLLGPNGAGKTSTIRMMIGITYPDSGTVRMFGEPFRREHLKRVGYLPEERGLYRKMKLLEHLVFFGELKGIGAAEARRRGVQWCERLGLTDWLEKKVEELSKGMQQKAQFIASLLHDPEFIIMDEPFSGLDPANALEMKNIMLELKKSGRTILFSTHRMDTVERLCDSISLINHGESVLQGELKEVKGRWGRNHVQIEYDGDGSFLHDTTLVQNFNDYGNYVEARLAPGADAQKLLVKAAAGARVYKFELMEPSLEEIFIETVNKPRSATTKAEAINA
jgi:ABC-2 type transport system ATP-binding protein